MKREIMAQTATKETLNAACTNSTDIGDSCWSRTPILETLLSSLSSQTSSSHDKEKSSITQDAATTVETG